MLITRVFMLSSWVTAHETGTNRETQKDTNTSADLTLVCILLLLLLPLHGTS